VRDNFGKAAQFGIDSQFTWFKDKDGNKIEYLKSEEL
jgi:hypothetical protein